MSTRRKRWTVEAPAEAAPEAAPEVIDELRAHRVGKLRTYARGLLVPWTSTEPTIDAAGLRSRHKVEHAALLDQLASPPTDATQGGSSSKASSRPPVSLDATSLLDEIARDSERWARDVLGRGFVAGVMATTSARRRRTEVYLVQLVHRAPVLDVEDLVELTRSVMGWWARARLATAWDSPPLKPHIPCPACGEWNKVQVRTYPTSAACRECHAAWDADTIEDLGSGVAAFLEMRRALVTELDVVGHFVDRGAGRVTGYDGPMASTVLFGVGPEVPWSAPPLGPGL